MRTCRGAYLGGALLLVGTNLCGLAIPWLLKLAIEELQHPASGRFTPGQYGAMIAAAAVGQGIIRVFSRTTLLNAGRRIEYLLREDLYGKLLTLDRTYFSNWRTGDILSRLANDLTNVRMLLGFGVLSVLNTFVVYTAALILLTRISPFLTICAIAPFPLMIFIVKKLSASMFKTSKRMQEALSRLTTRVEENVSAAAVVKAYCREEGEIETFRQVCDGYSDASMAVAKIRGFMLPVMASTGAFGTLIILFVGGAQVVRGELTLGGFVAFNGYLAMLVWPTIMLGWILNLVQRGAASMARLGEILNASAEVVEPSDPVDPGEIRGEIEFRNLTFSYGATEMLRGITLKVPAGSRIGIVGVVGSGKSTLVRMIPRLFPVPDGTVFIDGVDLNRISLEKIRAAVGFVPQEGFLFSRSIAENVAYGKPGAGREEIERAVRIAGLAGDVARFPQGLETMVGERGVTLSGGQRQRVSIARALLKEPSILVLDDPLSAVDADTEEEILSALSGYYGERTVLIVSHRLSPLRGCDQIIVLEQGAIVEQGSHEELLELGGRYAAIHKEEQLKAEIERL
ncbi:ABC transporter, ATP-binding/membrane protein [Citrifermentans bemidjiense Bem]|uniref:ABC transporter, ATP-binding/membrane protein n=1 Tax=Citrifermentans bemidjiense (strain ATCC BAA-1014 / DSM 16622 / JCM 12645 / Bem) TaxID=404380 RepID=B5EJ38_CITBB|nr:ABC transporter ATP-binding protein [Citrifermentans bemidjiense]ACH37064.1 ABC transporter, ATP-binding/membrane protein [Citrifermentans bemidjiense Bem]